MVFTCSSGQKERCSTRFCIDYHKVNDVIQKDPYPLPRIDDTLEALAGPSISQLWIWKVVIGR